MEDFAYVFCRARALTYGFLSMIIGTVAYVFGRHIMKTYDKTREETYKYTSMFVFSIAVIMMTYGILSVVLQDNMAFCALSIL